LESTSDKGASVVPAGLDSIILQLKLNYNSDISSKGLEYQENRRRRSSRYNTYS
jgi:hypothetical protein